MGKKKEEKKKLLGIEDLPSLDPKYDEANLPEAITTFLESEFSVHKPLPERLTKPVLIHELVLGNKKDMGGRGDIIGIVGKAKSGKSAVLGAIISSAYGSKIKHNLGFKLDLDPDKLIIHVDSEQSPKLWHKMMHRIRKTCGVGKDKDLPNFKAFSSATSNYSDRITQVDYLCHHYETQIDVLILDMVTDYVSDINSVTEAQGLLDTMVTWANMCECLLIYTIHFTKNTDELTGAIGTALWKKSANAIEVKHNENTQLKKVKTYRDISRIGDQLPKLEFQFKKKMPVLYQKGT